MTPDHDLALATVALLRAAPPSKRATLSKILLAHFRETLELERPDLAIEEIEARVRRHRARIDVQLAGGEPDA